MVTPQPVRANAGGRNEEGRHVAETGGVLTEARVSALEKKQGDDAAHGEIEPAHPDYLRSQDTFYAGTIKDVGRTYQQTFAHTYSSGLPLSSIRQDPDYRRRSTQ